MSTDVQPEPEQRDGREVGMDGALSDALVRSRRFFTRGTVSDDLRTLHQGGRPRGRRLLPGPVEPRQGGALHPRGELHRLLLVEGLRQGRDHHLGDPADRLPVGRARTRPEYEPRGCPRGAAFSWYTYSPTRVRYPYVRGVLLQMYREAKSQHDGDPVKAWAHIVDNPQRAKAYKSARGKGGLVRATLGRGDRDRRRRPRAHDQEVRPRPGRRLLADPGDVDGLARLRRPVRQPDRRLDAELLRLVRRPARSPRRRCSATRPTCPSPATGGTPAT